MAKKYSPVRRDLYLVRESVRKVRTMVRKNLRAGKLGRITLVVRRLNRGK